MYTCLTYGLSYISYFEKIKITTNFEKCFFWFLNMHTDHGTFITSTYSSQIENLLKLLNWEKVPKYIYY